MQLQDLFLTPCYLIVIYFVAYVLKSRVVRNPILKRYFIPALTLRIIGAISLGLIYQFYYKGGDTFSYYSYATTIWTAMWESPIVGIKLLLTSGKDFIPDAYMYTSRIGFYGDPPSYFIVRLAALSGIFNFNTYTIIGIFFSIFSFSGAWALFLALYRMYPSLHKELAISIFFIPSIFFWGSGLLKDSITIGALQWAFYAFAKIFIFRENRIRSAVIFAVAAYLLIAIKIYIFLCFLPTLFIWVFILFNKRIKSSATRAFLRPFLIATALVCGLLAANRVSSENKRYSLNNIAETSKITSSYLKGISDFSGGSGYDLGETEPGILGMLKKAPAAIFVSLYRPFLWESKNVNMLMAALESGFVIFLTLSVLRRTGIIKLISIIRNDNYLTFAMIFSLTFAFAVGISSYNFGTLVRYKIPLLPFFISSLYIIKYQATLKKQK